MLGCHLEVDIPFVITRVRSVITHMSYRMHIGEKKDILYIGLSLCLGDYVYSDSDVAALLPITLCSNAVYICILVATRASP